MQAHENLKTTLEYLPPAVRQSLQRLKPDGIEEIRLRCARPVAVCIAGRERFLTESGMLTDTPEQALHMRAEDIAQSFQAVCAYSLYSHERDIASGFVTIRGGCRVGICGTASNQPDMPMTLRHISGLNFRIAGEFIGCASQIFRQIGTEPVSILLAGTVGSGKTTMLRDLCRLLGNRSRTSLVDERGEIAAVQRGIPQHDVGLKTDVLDGYPRAVGILTALRVLTPEYIVCDELSTQEDVQAVLQAAGCGVQFAATCHAATPDDLYRRPVLRPLLDAGMFRFCVMLGHAGTVQTIRRLAVR